VILSETTEELRVLLVEDDPAVAEVYKHKLELDGYSVSVTTAAEAPLAASELAPDLVFLNVLLPSSQGVRVVEGLRADERTRHVPIVVLTDHDEVELRRHGFELDTVDHLIDTSALSGLGALPRRGTGLAVLPGALPPEDSAVPAFFSFEFESSRVGA
jgi:two-component system, OmpR family, response regulator MprA